eukprot:800187-Rhodomonas_salina.2
MPANPLGSGVGDEALGESVQVQCSLRSSYKVVTFLNQDWFFQPNVLPYNNLGTTLNFPMNSNRNS